MSPKKNRTKTYGLLTPEDLEEVFAHSPTQNASMVTGERGDVLSDEDLEDESELSYEEGIEDGLDLTTQPIDSGDTVVLKRETTRSNLAVIYVLATFSIFILGMIIAVIDGLNRDVSITDNLKEIIPLISGVFLGTLGFVLGYYFRKGNEEV